MVSAGADIADNFISGKKDILKDPNKHDFKAGFDQMSDLIKTKKKVPVE
jgi:hypothetical protein